MNMNTLYVFDETSKIERLVASLDRTTKKLVLCPITTDQDFVSAIVDRLGKEELELEVVNFTELFNKTSFSIREEYLRFISEFPNRMTVSGRNLKEYFRFPSGNFSAWWFSLLAEKNTIKTDSYSQLSRTLSILDIQEKHSCDFIICDIADNKLYRTLRDNGRNRGFHCRSLRKNVSGRPELLRALLGSSAFLARQFIKMIAIKWRMHGLHSRKEVLKRSKFLPVTYFPLIDRKQLKDKKFINRYYQPIQRALEKKYPGEIIWLAMTVNLEGFDWNSSAKLGKSINEAGYPLYLCEEWVTIHDLCFAFFEYARISFRFLRISSLLSRSFVYPGDVNIWTIFEKDWHESFAGTTMINSIVNYHMFRRLFGEIDKQTTVTYFFENQPWEKALNIAASGRKIKNIIGIQHTTVPLLLLNYFNHASEFKDEDFLQTIPAHVGCVGRIPRELLISSGWDREKVFVLGAIRFQQLRKHIEKEIPWETRDNVVIVALSIELMESMELLSYVFSAFRNPTKFRVLIKGHPALPVGTILHSMRMHPDPDIFTIVDTPLHEHLPKCKVMIVTGSSSSLESIACQCPIIIPRLVSTIDMNPLSGISDLPVFADSPQELRRKTEEIIERSDSPLNYEKCRDFIRRYCDFIPDDEFLKRIEDLNKENIHEK